MVDGEVPILWGLDAQELFVDLQGMCMWGKGEGAEEGGK